jgi:hypothetical protein
MIHPLWLLKTKSSVPTVSKRCLRFRSVRYITRHAMPVAQRFTIAVAPWLLLAFSLPRKGVSLRVSVWRKLQRYGSLPLGNSGYLLPNDLANREKFEWLATTIRSARGDASVVEVQSIDNCATPMLKKRFSEARAADYRRILSDAERAQPSKVSLTQIARLRQRFQESSSIDFFGSPMRDRCAGGTQRTAQAGFGRDEHLAR